MTTEAISVRWVSLGRLAYDDALAAQQAQSEKLLAGSGDEQTVYAVEHPPTITIGRGGSRDHIVAPPSELERIDMTVREVDRGGDVTYHGPGQFVLYPILHLEPWGNDIGRYVRMLEECAIRVLAEVGITADRMEGFPGVWVGNNKICAIGVRARRRPSGEFVTSHGIALNVTTDLSHFQTIIPCGLADKGVTSVAQELGLTEPFDFAAWEKRMQHAFTDVFNVQLQAAAS
ncbi:lipoyl(octanoyl) transferase LipB [Alicyclobacillus cycloheptanicus]|uniref:Octanoyltransferase n=1 Tax=Alicyclobacillus cycloheptanicus TaxID=1457 RepID=A0ABT9XF24_9BACL|nr:lipoyl(octanoyl) transferase LipB [Alicyclobacillus cycloheptanicus]MDQ0188418.1 lipoyl(octanoyl) transferase [Alicyclobacillus cycloheptanicus]WDM01121.1 lipoyl(octanoyl) transferase LipB [Alicyclobacillus cycloheptanicus]